MEGIFPQHATNTLECVFNSNCCSQAVEAHLSAPLHYICLNNNVKKVATPQLSGHCRNVIIWQRNGTKLVLIIKVNENVMMSPKKRRSTTCATRPIYQLTGITFIDLLQPSISCFICHLRINSSKKRITSLPRNNRSGAFFFLRDKQQLFVSDKKQFI